MIQVLGLRDFNVQGKPRKREVFFTKGWRFDKVQDIFDESKRRAVLQQIPTNEQFNLYFTVADCFEESGRKLKEQWVLPFDIDDIKIQAEDTVMADAEVVARAAASALGVSYEDLGVVFSGHGVQFHLLTTKPIVSAEFFDTYRLNYAALAQRIQLKLAEAGLQGKVDTSVFSAARLMRMPDTWNRKPGKTERQARIVNHTIKPLEFDLVERSGLQAFQKPDHVPDEALKNYPKPDTKAICAGCKFIVHCSTKQAVVTEPQWYAMQSVVARLDNGADLVHEFSNQHPKYSHYETELKIEQALMASGPRTCKNIEALWDGCKDCDYYEKVTSPIMIKGADYIASRDFGFRERRTDKNGNVRPGPAAFEDLLKEFANLHPYKTVADNGLTYIFNGKHWEMLTRIHLQAWAMERINPQASVAEMTEFVGRLKSQNVVTLEWFNTSRDHMMNFQNCVVDLRTLEVHSHKPEYGFVSVLPFDYDPRAAAPRWEQFLLEVMEGDAEMAQLLKEFGGYAISGDSYWLHKALILLGEGSNGKSVFMEILGEVAGKDAHSAVPLQTMGSLTSRYLMYNKLFNYSEETSAGALMSNEVFKTAAAGGVLSYKLLYSQEFQAPNKAKMIVSANNMPYSPDKTDAAHRRLLIVRFNVKFTPEKEGFDYFLKDKLRQELPGICNSLILAYRKVIESKKFSAKVKTDAELAQYIEESDNVTRFFKDQITLVDSEQKELAAEVYQAYVNYCEFNQEKPLTNVGFGKQLTRVWPEVINRRGFTTIREDSHRVIKGIKLRKEF